MESPHLAPARSNSAPSVSAPGQLCWDPATCSIPGQGTAFPNPSGASPSCGSGRGTDPAPCSIMGVDPNLRSPFVANWNLSIQHAFSTNLSLEVAYVGNHGSDLLGFKDINQPPLGAGWCMNTLTAAQLADACNGVTPGAKFSYQAASKPAVLCQVPLPWLYQLGVEQCPFQLQQPAGDPDQADLSGAVFHCRLHVRSWPRQRLPESFRAAPAEQHRIQGRSTPAATSTFGTASLSRPATTFPGRRASVSCSKAGRSTPSSTFRPPSRGTRLTPRTISAGPARMLIDGIFFGSPDGFRSGKNTIPYCTGCGSLQ